MTATADKPFIECRSISKRFGGVTALEQVDFTLRAGEVHGLVGSNGAGKSTLMKILAGALPDHEGTILLDGCEVRLADPQAARARGIAMVYQELSGVGQLSVAENLFLGRQPTTRLGRIDWRSMYDLARAYLDELRIDVDVSRRLDAYPLVVRQMVEIARGVHSGASALILDEPTSALSPPETRRLFGLIEMLRYRGVAIVFISHFLEDVMEICDRITVLRNGRRIETIQRPDFDKRAVIQSMLGYRLNPAAAAAERGATLPARTTAEPRLVARRLSRVGAFSDIDIEVAPGECLGLYGFVGSGHRELVHALGGALKPDRGQVLVDHRRLPPGNTHHAVRRGVVLVTADRAASLFLRAANYKNVTLAHLHRAVGEWLTATGEIRAAGPVLERVGCRPPDPRMLSGNLSGGNQQKVVLARWLLGPVDVLLLDEPTRGMDVEAKDEVMRWVAEAKARGAAVVLSSAEPEMLLAHADRILALHRGRVAHEFVDTHLDKTTLMRYA